MDGAEVLYVGKATAGCSGRRGLDVRLDEFRRFGAGEAARHWGGRYVWQLADATALLLAWRETGDADSADAKADLIAEFIAAHDARRFANRIRGRQTRRAAPNSGTDSLDSV
ncbi:hypothetical protein [Yinghuangia aomiensis]|uniref:hypothetical protein n=1 Tax=Yinghuangia aomiensis TaxID=676205 RepID=UPI0031E5E651